MTENIEASQISRRTALGALLAVLVAACGGTAKKPSGTSATTPPTAAAPATDTTAPAASTATASTTATTTAASTAATGAAPVVKGRNAYVTRAILASYVGDYGRAWRGTWSETPTGQSGVITGKLTIDPDARTFTAVIAMMANLLPGPALPALTFVLSADSFTYNGDTGVFAVKTHSDIGDVTVTSDRGIGTGTFKASLDSIPGHTDVKNVTATGVAFMPNEIPVDFTVTFTDGHQLKGHISLKPSS